MAPEFNSQGDLPRHTITPLGEPGGSRVDAANAHDVTHLHEVTHSPTTRAEIIRVKNLTRRMENLVKNAPPWFALTVPFSSDRLLPVFASHVRPLTGGEVDQFIDGVTSYNSQNEKTPPHLQASPEERTQMLVGIREENARVLDTHETIAVVLDGRNQFSAEGWIGDMIEASRTVNVLREAGKKVIVITSHPDLFDGTEDPDVKIVGIPKEIPGSPMTPWNDTLKTYLAKKEYLPENERDTDIPFLFPINAHMPMFINLGLTEVELGRKKGQINNEDMMDLFKKAVRPWGPSNGISVSMWAANGFHQLQALQVYSYLIGMDSAKNWQSLPDTYIKPGKLAQEIAQETIETYKCFAPADGTSIPVYIHPGVATGGDKIRTKFYPQEKWLKVIEGLVVEPETHASSVTILKPADPQQALMATQLAEHADARRQQAIVREKATQNRPEEIERLETFSVAVVPLSDIERRYAHVGGWTLGAFAEFLKTLSERNGVMIGLDSMPAGHLAPALNIPTVILGTWHYDASFFSPPDESYVVMPSDVTSQIYPGQVIKTVQNMTESIITENAAA